MESGRLENEPISVLCRRLATESRTGCLHIPDESGDEAGDIRIYLRGGRIYTATAPAGRARLGDRLVGGGHLAQADLDAALAQQRTEPGQMRLGDVLVARRWVTREVLRQVIREQISDSVAVALARSSGPWTFVDDEAVAEDIPLGLGMQDTLMEAARRLGQLEVIRARLGSLDAVVDFGSAGNEVRLSLRADEWAMLTHIDGINTVSEIAERAGYSQLEAARIIYGLLSAGVVNVVDGPVVGQGGETAPPEAYGDLLTELQDLRAPASGGGAGAAGGARSPEAAERARGRSPQTQPAPPAQGLPQRPTERSTPPVTPAFTALRATPLSGAEGPAPARQTPPPPATPPPAAPPPAAPPPAAPPSAGPPAAGPPPEAPSTPRAPTPPPQPPPPPPPAGGIGAALFAELQESDEPPAPPAPGPDDRPTRRRPPERGTAEGGKTGKEPEPEGGFFKRFRKR